MQFINRNKHQDPLNHNPHGEYYPATDNANPKDGWDIFNQIVGYGQAAFNTAGQIGAQIQGNKPIDQGQLGNGMGNYEATSGIENRNEKKILGMPQPIFYGAVAVTGITIAYIVFKAVTKKKT